jgi:hypothetical protein
MNVDQSNCSLTQHSAVSTVGTRYLSPGHYGALGTHRRGMHAHSLLLPVL